MRITVSSNILYSEKRIIAPSVYGNPVQWRKRLILQHFQYITAFSQIRYFPKVLCSGARSLSLKRAILLSLDTVQFSTLYLLTPSPSPRTPHPHPGGYRGCFEVAMITARITAKSQKTEHCLAASCADIVATFPRPFRGSSTPLFHREIAAVSRLPAIHYSIRSDPESGR